MKSNEIGKEQRYLKKVGVVNKRFLLTTVRRKDVVYLLGSRRAQRDENTTILVSFRRVRRGEIYIRYMF